MSTTSHKERPQAQQQEIDENLRNVRHRMVVFSGKGGVGKTTISTNLSCALRENGFSTGLLDADVTGPNVPHMLGLKATLRQKDGMILPSSIHGLKVISIASAISDDEPVMWRGPMRSRLLMQFLRDVHWDNLDYLVADLPPGTGDEVITMADYMKPDYALIVTIPQPVALMDSARAINLAKKLGIPNIGLIENMLGFQCPHCQEFVELFGTGGGRKQAALMGIRYLGALPFDMKTRQAGECGHPVFQDSQSAAARAFVGFAEEITKALEDQTSGKTAI